MRLDRRTMLLMGGTAIVSAAAGAAGKTFYDCIDWRPGVRTVRKEFLAGDTAVYNGLVLSRSEYEWVVEKVGTEADFPTVMALLGARD